MSAKRVNSRKKNFRLTIRSKPRERERESSQLCVRLCAMKKRRRKKQWKKRAHRTYRNGLTTSTERQGNFFSSLHLFRSFRLFVVVFFRDILYLILFCDKQIFNHNKSLFPPKIRKHQRKNYHCSFSCDRCWIGIGRWIFMVKYIETLSIAAHCENCYWFRLNEFQIVADIVLRGLNENE